MSTHDDRPYPASWAERLALVHGPTPVGFAEIAERAGVRPDTVKKWRDRYESFPKPHPDWTVSGAPVWVWEQVREWLWETRRIRTDAPAPRAVGWDEPRSAWWGDPELKAAAVELARLRTATGVISWAAADDYRGVLVGCAVNPQNASRHQAVDATYGIPQHVCHQLEGIFRSLLSPEQEARFALGVVEAIPVGADLSDVPTRLLLDRLADPGHGVHRYVTAGSDEAAVVETVAGLIRRQLAGDPPAEDEWREAYIRADDLFTANWRAAVHLRDLHDDRGERIIGRYNKDPKAGAAALVHLTHARVASVAAGAAARMGGIHARQDGIVHNAEAQATELVLSGGLPERLGDYVTWLADRAVAHLREAAPTSAPAAACAS